MLGWYDTAINAVGGAVRETAQILIGYSMELSPRIAFPGNYPCTRSFECAWIHSSRNKPSLRYRNVRTPLHRTDALELVTDSRARDKVNWSPTPTKRRRDSIYTTAEACNDYLQLSSR